ncbi:OmpA family protein [Hymenobacter sp. HSC-4F20]|uniref:OmpA family protein n=1 Tax=Hymenobacter sp. HSC-4F20 TaxID=2864135 RepID=UPI001C739BBC|nr:OmpA family protein [Hymenobacter sp. HSC-4F20]MBX0289385.1 OmpA family protein [Hymenobacter sp. HSC-4F20]
MKVLLTLALAFCWLTLCAQGSAALRPYPDTAAQYHLAYPSGWQLLPGRPPAEITFVAGQHPGRAEVTLTQRSLSDKEKNLGSLLTQEQADSVWRALLRLPQVQVVRVWQHRPGNYEEVRYAYTYAPAPAPAVRSRVVGRRLWYRGMVFQVEYRAPVNQDARYLPEGEKLLESFQFTDSTLRPAVLPQCDNKMYGIAALRFTNDTWEDDCRTIHEFSVRDPAARPKVHWRVLPFQSYALAKGFDNCLYSVTKAPTNAPERVYRYNPATGQGSYTTWQLPPQGSENVWISAATDERGHLYFMTSDAGKLVALNPADGTTTTLWATDPLRKAPFYATIGFAGAGSHGNFCLDDARTLYQVYSTDGSLMRVNLTTQQPAPVLTTFTGLPERGGYSDLLLQTDEQGRRWLYMAGPKALYRVDMSRGKAEMVRRGIYTDLAGCNLFRSAPSKTKPVPAAAPSPLPATGTWRGRVLDAATLQPLPQARLRLGPAAAETTVPLTAEGAFSFLVEPGHSVAAHVQLAGYLPLDSVYSTLPGPYGQDILLHPLAVGTTLQLEKVRFEQGSARLLSSSYPALRKLLKLLLETPSLTIELRGHTDNVGDPAKNVQLSERRVATVKSYLVRHGVAQARITGLGLGGTEPRASNEREATRQLNRRVEFRVMGI